MAMLGRREALVATLALAAGPGLAQPSPAPDVAALREDVLRFRESLRRAIEGRDAAALAHAYAENFSHIRDAGRIDLKPERVALLLRGEPAIETAPEENMDVQIFSDCAAVVTGESAVRRERFRWLTVYVRHAGSWQVAISQATRIR